MKSAGRAERARFSAGTARAGGRYLLVLNPGAGDEDPRSIAEAVRARLGDVRVLPLEGELDLGGEIERSLEEERVVVAAGGDGTVNAVVQHLVGRGTLGVIPGGTLNHFCRDLGVRNLGAALDVLDAGRTMQADVGQAGGRFFVNNTGLGLYPEVVYEREHHEHRLGKWRAAAAASLRVMRRAEPLVGRIAVDGDERALLAWVIFVGNNRFGTGTGRIGVRQRLDEGVLDVRLLTLGTRRARRSRLAWRVLRGRPWSPRRIVRTEGKRVEVHLEGRPRLVSWDGESGEPVSELGVELLPGALRVVAPGAGA